MINSFLKAKHWQLFTILFLVPILFQFIIMYQMMTSAFEGNPEDVESMFSFMQYLPFFMIIWLGLLYGWMWSVGIGISEKLPEDLKLNTVWFKASVLFPAVYMVIFSFFMASMFTNIGEEPNIILFTAIFPLHILAMLCGFYTYYFIAKVIKTAELKRRVQFGDFVGEFFLLWFFFIGIWILQPRINRLAQDEPSHSELDSHLLT